MLMALTHTDIFQSVLIYAFQYHITEDSHVRKLGRPVPARHTVGFSQIRKSVYGICVTGNFPLQPILFFHIKNRRVKPDFQQISLFF